MSFLRRARAGRRSAVMLAAVEPRRQAIAHQRFEMAFEFRIFTSDLCVLTRVLGFLLLRITLRPLEQALLAALLNLPSPILQLVARDCAKRPRYPQLFFFRPGLLDDLI